MEDHDYADVEHHDDVIRGTANMLICLQTMLTIISCGLVIFATDVFIASLIVIVLIILFYVCAILGVDSRSRSIVISYILISILNLILIYSTMVVTFVLVITSDNVSQYGIRNLNQILFLVGFGVLAFIWSVINLISIIISSTLLKLLNQRGETNHDRSFEQRDFQPLPYPPPYHIYTPRPTYGWQVVVDHAPVTNTN